MSATKSATTSITPPAAVTTITIGAMSHADADAQLVLARAKAGPYTVITSHITATKAYGYETQIVYMLAKDEEMIADNDARVAFEIERVATDGKTGKPVADITRYTYRDGDTRYVVTFERQKTFCKPSSPSEHLSSSA